MNIRLALPEETHIIKDLWEYCFEDSPEFTDWFFSTRYESQNTLVLLEEGKICSALQLLPYNLFMRGKSLATSYLVGVSTWPEERGKGHVKKLLIESLNLMRSRGQWISILLPFDPNFYKKYGWGTCYSYNQYRGSNKSLAKYSTATKNMDSIRPINMEADFNDLDLCYQSSMKNLNGYIIRSYEDWERIIKDIRLDGGEAYVYIKNQEITGYFFISKLEETVQIRCLYSKDFEGYSDIFRFIIESNPLNRDIVWSHEAGYPPMPDMLESNFRMEEKIYAMGRIVDLVKAFEGYYVHEDLSIIFEISDSLLDWNNQRFEFTSTNNRLHVSPSKKKPDFSLSITSLSQLLWGYYTSFQAIEYGRIDILNTEKIKLFHALFPKTKPFIYEEY